MGPEIRPRMLADDLGVMTGPDGDLDEAQAVQLHTEAAAATVRFLEDMGSWVSQDKTVTLATTAWMRGALKRTRLRPGDPLLRVSCDARDLGSHISA
eukprot:15478831-Alexandrium_andersonii.AAC.1